MENAPPPVWAQDKKGSLYPRYIVQGDQQFFYSIIITGLNKYEDFPIILLIKCDVPVLNMAWEADKA